MRKITKKIVILFVLLILILFNNNVYAEQITLSVPDAYISFDNTDDPIEIFKSIDAYTWGVNLRYIYCHKAAYSSREFDMVELSKSETEIVKVLKYAKSKGYTLDLTQEEINKINSKDYSAVFGSYNYDDFNFDNYLYAFDYIEDWYQTVVEENNPGEENETKKHTLGEIISDADSFIKEGTTLEDNLSQESLKMLSDTLYNIFFITGTIIAFAVGGILAIKFITSGVEGKAEIKAMLLPYIIGCVILFGSFTIWKVVLTIVSDTTKSSVVYEASGESGGSTTHQSSSGRIHGGSSGNF